MWISAVAVFSVVIFSQGNWFVRKNKANQDNERASYSSDVDAQRSPPTPGAAKREVGAGVPHEAPIPLLNTPELSLKPSDTAVEPMAANSQEEPRLSPQEVAMDADAHSEVGRKIPVSKSIESLCRDSSSRRRFEEPCTTVRSMLDTMAREPRDNAWAPDVEKRLRAQISRQLADADFRTLECRTSMCAVEVASATSFVEFLVGNDLRAIGVEDWAHYLVASEPRSTGARIIVTMTIYERPGM